MFVFYFFKDESSRNLIDFRAKGGLSLFHFNLANLSQRIPSK